MLRLRMNGAILPLQCELVKSLRFEVFMVVVSVKISVSWDMRPCSMIDGYQNFEGTFVPVYQIV
jgi:hypothetical protein